MEYYNYPIVIIGSGLAGLYSALKIHEKLPDERILIITKSNLGESNSIYAQGGIVGVLKENKKDSVASHIADTLSAGAGLSDFNIVKYVSENSDYVIKDLISKGVEFDSNSDGDLLYTLEGAHSVKRILHCEGDATGRGIVVKLSSLVSEISNIDVMQNTMAVELLVEDDTCCGCVIFDGKDYNAVLSDHVIITTGGIGQLYKNTTNPKGATGDGIAIAYNAGAILQDMEFIQFHPTAFAVEGVCKNFLVSEAVRGEGAKLLDINKHSFMSGYHELEELAPRDIVARAIYNQMQITQSDFVYLDATKISEDIFKTHFPTINNMCLKNNIDASKDYIPVHPAAHYFMGGIKSNLYGKTSLSGLYAIGEASSTGLHGANRLASNSLLECAVMGYSLAEYLSRQIFNDNNTVTENIERTLKKYSQELGFIEYDTENLKSELQNIMWNGAGIVRNEESLKNANIELQNLKSKFIRNQKCLNIQEYEFKNMLTVAQIIINSALKRKESRGAHYRSDYQFTKDIAEHNCVLKQQGELSFVR
ncbi:L-aspartate oxidase [bacterium]|nr:L-aspartate oxidase [bacterium]